ncbi:MAG: hypothetical protein HOL90_01140 [Candidatus Nitrosopelagicus sp.]|nr:hypothetical protein [Candidatus Nitrosopelagicus sp.]
MPSLVDCPMCLSEQSMDDVFLPKSDLDEYPINRDYYTPLDALDLKKTKQSWIALLYCESTKGYGTSYRLYMWRNFKGQSTWKVALCNISIDDNILIPDNLKRIIMFKQKARN